MEIAIQHRLAQWPYAREHDCPTRPARGSPRKSAACWQPSKASCPFKFLIR